MIQICPSSKVPGCKLFNILICWYVGKRSYLASWWSDYDFQDNGFYKLHAVSKLCVASYCASCHRSFHVFSYYECLPCLVLPWRLPTLLLFAVCGQLAPVGSALWFRSRSHMLDHQCHLIRSVSCEQDKPCNLLLPDPHNTCHKYHPCCCYCCELWWSFCMVLTSVQWYINL